MKVLFILSRLLGGKTFSNAVVSLVKEIPDILPFFLFFDPEDWGKYQIPFFYRKINKFIPAQTARAKFEATFSDEKPDFDCVFIQSFELIQGFADLISRKPTIVAHDCTNILGHWLVYNQNKTILNYFRFLIKCVLTIPVYKRIVRQVDVFIPRTQWCAKSLRDHYRVDLSRIIVAPGCLDLNLWKPNRAKDSDSSTKLLFVGNDFERKGGYFLLDLYTNSLQGRFELTIVSNDRSLKSINFPRGVKLVKGVSHNEMDRLINIYSSSDIFVYPTRKDQLGLVLLEAAASGLPIIATNVGGIPDVVIDGYNGFLMPYSAGISEWTSRIEGLAEDKTMMLCFGEAGRQLAERSFSKEAFKIKLLMAFKYLGFTIDW
ncbi:MAG: hypothetical protein DRH50_15980 [Deltaproteobacteria bacterium]|nr:MAG: hypothetical protein DRH50_15980 [Deltaproteobacteria bacterium]